MRISIDTGPVNKLEREFLIKFLSENNVSIYYDIDESKVDFCLDEENRIEESSPLNGKKNARK